MLSSAVFVVFALVGVTLGLALYFLPTIIAQQKKHRSLSGIFVLNLLLGWSLLGWIGALVWALSNPQPIVVVQNNPAYLQNYGAPGYGPQPGYPPQGAYPPQPIYPPQPVYPPQAGYALPPVPDSALVPAEPAGYVAQPAVVLSPVSESGAVPPSAPGQV